MNNKFNPCDVCPLTHSELELDILNTAARAVKRWVGGEITESMTLSNSSDASALAAACIKRCYSNNDKPLSEINVSGQYF